ncbi:MAG: hypothetical protein HUJ54_01525 [Erysipelotrichaceae bacterium]|nr:hypothetical protein [Erysipelotrichaceae bacterium]
MFSFITFVLAIAVVAIHWFAAKEMQMIAESKGAPRNYFWWCFWLPMMGYAMVIALPNSQNSDSLGQLPKF